MANPKLWRFPFMTRTVMGFLASSLNLASGHVQADVAQPAPPACPPRDPRLLRRRPAPQVADRRHDDARRDEAAPDRGPGALAIAGPPAWLRRHSSASGITEYSTRNLRAGVASFVVPPHVPFHGTEAAFQRELLRNISAGMPVVEGSTRTGTVGSFGFVSCVMQPPWGAPRHIVLYTALWAGKAQALLFGADCHQLFHDHLLGVHALVQKIVVPTLPDRPGRADRTGRAAAAPDQAHRPMPTAAAVQ
jgi:hypothetical protein